MNPFQEWQRRSIWKACLLSFQTGIAVLSSIPLVTHARSFRRATRVHARRPVLRGQKTAETRVLVSKTTRIISPYGFGQCWQSGADHPLLAHPDRRDVDPTLSQS